ncbi:MAG TPA: L,D-transpeptidase [Chitinophagaceae bacterium]
MRRAYLSFPVLALIFISNTSFYVNPDYYLVIDKSDYNLYVFDEDGWLLTFPVVFGSKDQSDKMMEGDRKTPEGSFRIVNKRVHEKWCRFLLIDYPNPESRQKFNERKAKGLIPQSARIGGSIGIHGTWPREDFAIDRFQNWTQGCISMKNSDVIKLYGMIHSGTRVIIQK